jgi:prolyl-tRNA editing enzyme YbaK/EbsC (Cys-tRNA(Pro) deacylase)
MNESESIEWRVLSFLQGSGVPYKEVRIDPDFADTAAFCEKYGYGLEVSCNTIVVASKKEPKQYCACLVQATRRLDVNKAVKDLMGVSRLSFATSDETKDLTGMMIGGVTMLALPDDLPLYVDAPIMDIPEIILGGGSRSLKILVSSEVLNQLPNLRVIDGLSLPPREA